MPGERTRVKATEEEIRPEMPILSGRISRDQADARQYVEKQETVLHQPLQRRLPQRPQGFDSEVRDLYRCFYCGLPADSIDHVIPKSLLRMLAVLGDSFVAKILKNRHRVHMVRSCKDCNSVLGRNYFDKLPQRKAYIKRRLRQRHHAILAMPTWEDSDFGEMSEGLRNWILKEQERRDIIKERLRW